jgi:ribose/xylose/arabinose/galactoside ABC-type transport system permease subunit
VPVAIIFSVYVLSGLLAGVADGAAVRAARAAPRRSAATSTSSTRSAPSSSAAPASPAGGHDRRHLPRRPHVRLIFSLMTQLNLSTEVQQVTKGLIVLGAVLLQRPEARY